MRPRILGISSLDFCAPPGSNSNSSLWIRLSDCLNPGLQQSTAVSPAGVHSSAELSAVDKGLRPGTQYTYSLFTRNKGGW